MSENETPSPGEVPAPVNESLPVDHQGLPDQEAPAPVIEKVTEPAPAVDEGDDSLPKDTPESYVRFSLPRGANENVLPISPVFRAATDKENVETPFHIASLPCDSDTLNSLVDSYPSMSYDNSPLSREWSAAVEMGSTMLPQGNMYTACLSRQGSQWGQRAQVGAGTLGPMRSLADSSGGPGTKLAGNAAVDRIVQHMGLGSGTVVPLWHSGFWVTARTPTLAARLELQRRLDAEKITLGRVTGGLAFSNISVYTKNYLADFALAHVVSANVRYAEAQELKDLILSTDIPTLIWGMLSTMHPSGYVYHQPCVNDPSKCQHIAKEVIDLNKILFVDTQSLTENQLRHMSNRGARHELKDLLAYRDQHRYASMGVFEVKGPNQQPIKIQLKVPTITEYASGGYAWVDGITNDIQRAFGTNLQREQRNQYILERAQVTNMCEYSHWVARIALPSGEESDDIESIRSVLTSISGEPSISAPFFEAVTKYIDDTTVALIALPRFDCPSCGKSATPEETKHPYLNPIEVETLFFTLVAQHIAKATQ